ncbi:hypothetical protein BH20VER3_BH20VER3_15040 [soil metagenome]
MKRELHLVKITSRVALGIIWLYEGIVPKLLFLRTDQFALLERSGLVWRSMVLTALPFSITSRITMKTVTLKIPDSLDLKIRRAIARRKESFSHLARRALAREVEEGEIDFARLAAPYRGMFKGEADLSTREGYGNKNAR